MDKIEWYYRQPVSEDDVNFAFNSVQETMRGLASHTEQPYGIVGGYDVTPSTGLTVLVYTVSGTMMAVDKEGRLIRPTSYPFTQSVASTSTGSSTAVTSGGNERWVSLFARGGRSFLDAAEDGFGNSVRKTSLETLNALGEADHPAGAYDPVPALAAGVNLLHIVAGTEDVIGNALRPALLEDAVLVADVRLVNGQSTLTTSDIYFDRREVMLPDSLRSSLNARDLYYGTAGPRFGVTHPSIAVASATALSLNILGGRGYVRKVGAGSNDRQFRYYDYGAETKTLPVPAPDGSSPRIDLVVVDGDGALRVVTGTASADPSPPAVPADTVPLFQMRALAGTTNTSTWPITRRSHRRLPYPYSTAHGILEGCRLQWRTMLPADVTLNYQQTYLVSKNNKIVIDGEVIEFVGGFDTFGNPKLKTYPDVDASPFVVENMHSTPYYIYACRAAYYDPITHPQNGSPVTIIESLTAPIHPQGFPAGPLRGPFGAIPASDCFLIGVGWTEGGLGAPSQKAACVRVTNDDWFYLHSNWQNSISITGDAAAATYTPRSVPQTGHVSAVKLKVNATVVGSPSAATAGLGFYDYGAANNSSAFFTISVPPISHASGGSMSITLGEYEIAAPAGTMRLSGSSTNANWHLQTRAVKLELPYVRLGVGVP